MPDATSDASFSRILNELQNLLDQTKTAIVAATDDSRFSDVAKLNAYAEELYSVAKTVEKLQQRFPLMQAATGGTASKAPPKRTGNKVQRRQRRKPGEITHQKTYQIPILKALVELGGSASTSIVLDRIEVMMKNALTPADNEITDTHPSEPRWRLNAKWCRKTMKDKGLISKNSPHGTWEITDAGRKYLKENDRPTILRGD